jgi:carbonic anhydrase/acetyltransferase-like protein (isoleucine patch superfamily)/dTDP-4-dehydrorhamnose 3,5-epimerase-like enzyme
MTNPNEDATHRLITHDATIDPRATVDPGASIGTGCIVHSGAYVGSGVVLEAEVEIGANATLVATPEGEPQTRIGRGVRIGANATIYPGIALGELARVQPGTVVMRDVPPHSIVEGNPAMISGYVDSEQSVTSPHGEVVPATGVTQTPVQGVTVHRFPVIPDLRGSLSVGEFERQIPFAPKRYFLVFDVPSREIRGEHAHHECHEFLICVHGSCSVLVDDGSKRFEVLLDSPSKGLYLPPMTWRNQYKYTADAMLLVFASDYYDNADYIRDYTQYIAAVQDRKAHQP